MHYYINGEDGARTFQYPSVEMPPIPGYQWDGYRRVLTTFETIFTAEMSETTTYWVPRRGIYFTPALVDSADQSFPLDIAGAIPEKTKSDWRAAGRCLAFNLLTASGFHVARAVEGTMEAYYQIFCGKPGKTLNSWNDYIDALKKVTNSGDRPAPSAKTLTELDQMRVDYRNPIAHPRAVLSESDARMLFDNGESAIIAMAQEIKSAMDAGGIQPALAVVSNDATFGA